jgi:hypothetical protein
MYNLVQIIAFNGYNLRNYGTRLPGEGDDTIFGRAPCDDRLCGVRARPDRAVNIVKSKAAQLEDDVVVVSGVSEELLHALGIAPGRFARADGHLTL